MNRWRLTAFVEGTGKAGAGYRFSTGTDVELKMLKDFVDRLKASGRQVVVSGHIEQILYEMAISFVNDHFPGQSVSRVEIIDRAKPQ